ncbi:MFS transporter [Halobacillus naozhouensis]|uniref:MFS transporter n=1 Tax=Halobacillus naozhouensis TaxID=554880 RepID=A0ABY8J2Y4_9BACI|nr:MFS transporter [Halobacillus naozhouensis]WFT75125.1 MFS transporter [Halobacillus naozhouensis]
MEEQQTAEELKKSGRAFFKTKSFFMLWIASLCSSLSMSIFMFVQSWYVVQGLGLEAALGIVLISLSVPRIIFMLAGGVLSDRKDQARIMFWSDLSRAFLACLLAILFVFAHPLPIWVLIINAIGFGILGGIFEPARDSIIPTVVEPDMLTRANSVLQGTMQIALFAGPLFAGVILGIAGYGILFLLIGGLLVIGSLCVVLVNSDKGRTEVTEQLDDWLGFWVQLKEGIMYLWCSKLLRALFIIAIVVNFFMSGPLFIGLPIFVEGVLEGSALDYSYVQGGLTFGMILGSIIMGIINIRRKRGSYALILMAAQGIIIILFSQSNTIWLAVGIIIFIGLLNPAINIPLISMIQEYTDPGKMGRVMSLIRMASFGLMPLSYAMVSFLLGQGVSIRAILFWSALPLIISVIVLFACFPVLRKAN